jgi:hypothetical protein
MALMICSKCGKQFYGIGCPECDFPAPAISRGPQKWQRLWGLLFMAAGVAVLFKALAIVPASERVQVLIAGSVFVVGGLIILTNAQGRIKALMVGVVCVGMSVLGVFTASSSGPLEGGIPLIPASWNQAFGRGLFGFGALLTAAIATWCFWRAVKPAKNK